MRGTLFLTSLAHLLVVCNCFIILAEKEDNEKLENDGMLPYVYRPRYSASASPNKRTLETDFSDEYREIRAAANHNSEAKTRYVIIRGIESDEEEEKSKRQTELGYQRGRYRFALNGKRRSNPHQRPRFNTQGRDAPKTAFNYIGRYGKKESRRW